MPDDKLMPLSWPKSGYVENAAYSMSVPFSTLDSLNVRNYDTIENRLRGGQRPGIARVIDDRVNGTAQIQYMTQIVEAVEFTGTAGVGSAFADPGTLPAGRANSVAWSPNSKVLIVGHDTSPYITAYPWSDVSGFGTKYSNPSSGMAGDAEGVAFHPDGDYVAVAGSDGGGNLYVAVYEWDDTTGFGSQITPSVALPSTGHSVAWSPDGNYLAVGHASSPYVTVFPWTGTALGTKVSNPSTLPAGTGLGVAWHPDGNAIAVSHPTSPYVTTYIWTGSAFGAKYSDPASLPGNSGQKVSWRSDGNYIAVSRNISPYISVYPWTAAGGFGTQVANAADLTVQNGNGHSFDPTNAYLAQTPNTTGNSSVIWNYVDGFGTILTDLLSITQTGRDIEFSPNGRTLAVGANGSPYIRALVFNVAARNPSAREVRLVAVAGGDVYLTDTGITSYGITVSGDDVLSSSEPIDGSVAFQKLFFADGGWEYKYLDFADNTVKDWRGSVTAGELPVAATGTAYGITGVNTGTPSFTVAEDLSGLSDGDRITISGSTGNDGVYQVASTSGTGPTTITTDETMPDGTADGLLAQVDVGCRIIETYRGRVAMAGLKTEPQNWFMSKSGDPFNWEYSPATPSAVQAVAGNNSEVGEVGDVVTALAPYQDDMMIMGGANSLWVMRGDPAAGGAIDNISPNIGIVGQYAWTYDSGVNFYWFSRNGLYRMTVGQWVPELVSRGRLDETFKNVDVADKIVRLAYDHLFQGVHVFITDPVQPAAAPTHYFWDERNDAFWPEQYTIAIGPTCVTTFLADNPEKSSVFLGGFDGYIRKFDETKKTDDATPTADAGTVISSHVQFPPITPGQVWASGRLDDVHLVFDSASDPMTFKVFAGDTVEQAYDNAIAGTARMSKTVRAGRNTPMRHRIAQNTFILHLSQNGLTDGGGAYWAYEVGGLKTSVLNRMHGRRV